MSYRHDPATAFLDSINKALGQNIPTYYKTRMDQQRQKTQDVRQRSMDQRTGELHDARMGEFDREQGATQRKEAFSNDLMAAYTQVGKPLAAQDVVGMLQRHGLGPADFDFKKFAAAGIVQGQEKPATPGSEAALINALRNREEYDRSVRTDIGVGEMTDKELGDAIKQFAPKRIVGVDEKFNAAEKTVFAPGAEDYYTMLMVERNKRSGIVDRPVPGMPFTDPDQVYPDDPYKENIPAPPASAGAVSVQQAKQAGHSDAKPGDVIWTPNGMVEVR